MSYVSRDEMADTVDEARTDLERAIEKAELRLESAVDHSRKVAVAATLRSKEFQQVQEDIDELRDQVLTLLKLVKLQGRAIEELSLS